MADESANTQQWDDEASRSFLAERTRHERMRRDLTDRLLDTAAIERDESVVDIGCGFAETSLLAAEAAPDGHVLGVDLSAEMLAEARRLAEERGLDNLRFVEADAQDHAFPPGEFDVLISGFGMMFFTDPQAAFTNIASALKPGGRAAFVCWREREESEFFSVPLAAIAAHTAPPERPGPQAPGPFSLADPQRIRDLMGGAGFRDIAVEGLDIPFLVGEDPEDVLGFYRTLPVTGPSFSAADETTAAAITGTLREALASRHGTDGVALDSATWLVTARR